MPKVVITHCAAVAATGQSLDAIWQAVKQQHSGIRAIESWDTSNWPYHVAAELMDYKPRQLIQDRKLLKLLSRQDVVGLAAAEQAVNQSGLLTYREALSDPTEFNDRTGVFVASPGNKFCQQYDFLPLLAKSRDNWSEFANHLFEQVHPMWLLRILPNNVLAYTGIQFGFKGANHNITNHVAGGLQALMEAQYHIQQGLIDRAIVVAYDTGMEPQGLMHYAALGVLSPTDCRPYDIEHDGTILGEAGVALVIESEASAKARGAIPQGEILASSFNAEAKGIFGIDASGEQLAKNLITTLDKADIKPEQLGMATLHANGNKLSDQADALAWQQLNAPQVPVTGFKWSVGHTIAAAGLLETVLSLQSLNEGVVPGIANLKTLAPDCESLSVSHDNRSLNNNLALVSCRGFGSFNASVLIRSC